MALQAASTCTGKLYTVHGAEGQFCSPILLQGPELVHIMHAAKLAWSTSGSPFPILCGRAAKSPEISSSPCPGLEYPLIPPITATKCLFNCCLCVRSMRLQASRHSKPSCSFLYLACTVSVLLNTSRLALQEVMTYTAPGKTDEAVGFP
jgi:hypothetical protein